MKISLVLEGHRSLITDCALSPDGTRFATASRDRTAALWDATTGRQTAILEGHRAPVQALGFSPDGRHLVTASADSTARLWNLDGELLHLLDGHQGALEAAVFLDDQTLACAWNMWSFGHVTLWDIREVEQLTTHRGEHGQLVFDLAAHNGLLAGALAPGFVSLWDHKGQAGVLRAHGETVRRVAFSMDGRLLASATKNEIKVWSVPDYEPVATCRLPGQTVQDIAFAPDGRSVAAATGQGVVAFAEETNWKEASPVFENNAPVRRIVFILNGEQIGLAQEDRLIVITE